MTFLIRLLLVLLLFVIFAYNIVTSIEIKEVKHG